MLFNYFTSAVNQNYGTNTVKLVLVKILYYPRKIPNKELYCYCSCENIGDSQGIILQQKTVNWTNDGNILEIHLKNHCDDANAEHLQLGNIQFFVQKAYCGFVYLLIFLSKVPKVYFPLVWNAICAQLVSPCSKGTSQQEKKCSFYSFYRNKYFLLEKIKYFIYWVK